MPCLILWLFSPLSFQLIPFIDSVLQDPKLQEGELFDHLTDTLGSWEAKADTEKDDIMAQNLEKVLLRFWKKLSEICVEKIDGPEADVKSVVGVSNLLQVLQKPKSSLKSNKKKACKVRFADEVTDNIPDNEKLELSEAQNSEVSDLKVEPSFVNSSANHLSPLRQRPLEDLVCKLAEMSMNYVNKHKSEQHLRFLSTLLNSFSSTKVFKMLLNDEKHGTIKKKPLEIVKLVQKNPAVQFLYQKLIGWLNEDQRKDAGFLVDILYSALHCCDNNLERKTILDDLTEVLMCVNLFKANSSHWY